jgi:hypothetical protein
MSVDAGKVSLYDVARKPRPMTEPSLEQARSKAGRRSSSVSQETDHVIWTIVELFYRSQNVFSGQFESYEKRVLGHSYKKGLDRLDLRLNPQDLADLLDLKAIERMRDSLLFPLKDLCHEQFRNGDQTDSLDRYVSDIFHEISILKEEHYNVTTYAPQYERIKAKEELSHILEEAHFLFPKKLNHIRFLLDKGRQRMEELLPTFTNNEIFLRSLYLCRDDFVSESYETGLLAFYDFMYPELGAIDGYFETGMSFFASGFYGHALDAFEGAQAQIDSGAGGSAGKDAQSRLAAIRADLKINIDLIRAAAGSGNGEEQLRLDRRAGLVG